MEHPFPKWITKQMISRIENPDLGVYLLALEGWRRGLSLTWHDDLIPIFEKQSKYLFGTTFSLSSDNKTHLFFGPKEGRFNSEELSNLHNRSKLLALLKSKEIGTPDIINISKDVSLEDAIVDANFINLPVLIRWKCNEKNKRVKIHSKTELINKLKAIYSYNFRELTIEEYIKGTHYRFYVIKDTVVSVIRKSKSHVTGNGKSTLKELIQIENILRKRNPYLSKRIIKMNESLNKYIGKSNYTLKSIPEVGEKVILRPLCDDTTNVINEVPTHLKKMAIKSLRELPEVDHGEIEIIVTDQGATVVDVELVSDLSMHIFPLRGKPFNISEAIIDYYFPETKGMAKDRTKIYFDYLRIKSLFRKMLVTELHIADAPNGRLYAKRYIVSGKVRGVGYKRWIRRQAGRENLHGYTRSLKNGEIVIVVASSNKEKVNNFKNICYKGPRRAKVEKIKEFDWKTQIKLGFEIRRTLT